MAHSSADRDQPHSSLQSRGHVMALQRSGVGAGVVGACDGALVGAVVGDPVGANVGLLLGPRVVGDSVGSLVGATLGVGVVGAAVGSVVGREDEGAVVGAEVGAEVGSRVSSSTDKALSGTITIMPVGGWKQAPFHLRLPRGSPVMTEAVVASAAVILRMEVAPAGVA